MPTPVVTESGTRVLGSTVVSGQGRSGDLAPPSPGLCMVPGGGSSWASPLPGRPSGRFPQPSSARPQQPRCPGDAVAVATAGGGEGAGLPPRSPAWTRRTQPHPRSILAPHRGSVPPMLAPGVHSRAPRVPQSHRGLCAHRRGLTLPVSQDVDVFGPWGVVLGTGLVLSTSGTDSGGPFPGPPTYSGCKGWGGGVGQRLKEPRRASWREHVFCCKPPRVWLLGGLERGAGISRVGLCWH